ncbi:MAG TPA: SDR family oxidoreductase [Solimonas sp.]|nr:SDR family oxidoreductase [Solimonas sp.]
MPQQSRSVFITGGSSGLGAAVAARLAQAGWRVAIAGRDPARLEAAAAPHKANTFALDVADPAALDAAIRAFRPDALVCCAGMLGRGSVWDELTPELFARTWSVNVGGTFNACRAVMRLWREAGTPGDIVNVSSLGGIRGMQKFAGFAAYGSTKHAVVGLTEALALDGKAHGIRVNAIAPGTMRTAMTQALGLNPSTLPEAVAPTVEFLLDRAQSGPITGTTVEIHCNDD